MGEAGHVGMEWMSSNNFGRPWGSEAESGYLVPGLGQGDSALEKPIKRVVGLWALD